MAFDLDDEELKATRKLNGIDKDVGSIEERVKNYIQTYNGLKRNKDIVKSIDKDYFFDLVDCLIKAYKELEEKQIIKNEQIRNGQPVIANTRLTVLDVLYLITEFIKRHEEEFRRDYVDISINQIISAIDYFIDNSIPVSLVEEKIEELEKKINDIPDNEGDFSKAILIRTKITLKELLEKRK